jgi:nitrogen fixation protein FixH
MTAMAHKEFTGRHLLIVLAAFFGTMLAVNGVFVYFALSTYSGVESQTAYQDGLKYNQRIEEARRQEALGWSHQISVADRGRIELALKDANGAPVTGLAISAQIERPAGEESPRELAIRETRPGIYAVGTESLGAGNWVLVAEARKTVQRGADALYRIKERLWLKPNS